MKRLFAAMLAVACVVGSTPVLARGGGHGFGAGRGFAGAYARALRLA
jgi:hypothetical protein